MTTESFFEGTWGWYVSDDLGEHCQGPFESREAAIEEGVDNDFGWDEDAGTCNMTILEARKDNLKFSDVIDVSHIDERAHDGPWEDLLNEDGESLTEGITPTQWADLEKRLRAVADQWQIENKIVISPYVFMATRNEEQVTVPQREVEPS